MSDWRRKPVVKFMGIETSGAVFVDTPTPRWSLEGEHAEEDMARVMRGEVCVRCWTPYPEAPTLASARRICDQVQNFGRGRAEAKRLLSQGRCGVCGAECSAQMAETFFEGEIVATRRSEQGDPNQHDLDPTIKPLIVMNQRRGVRAS